MRESNNCDFKWLKLYCFPQYRIRNFSKLTKLVSDSFVVNDEQLNMFKLFLFRPPSLNKIMYLNSGSKADKLKSN
jgi:hypothetical protein